MVERQSYQSADDMPAELATAVLCWILSVADTKHAIGLQFSHWVTGTPSLEGAVGSAAIAQDELGHARSLHAILRNYPGAPDGIGAENDLEARETYFAPAALTPRWESWLQVITVNVVLDRALQVAVAHTRESAFQPLAGRSAKILQEERFHRVFGDSWLARLVQHDDTTRDRLQRQVHWAWEIASQWLGPDDDPITNTLAEAGVLNGNGAAMRRQWLGEVQPLLAENGLTVADSTPNWSAWSFQFRHSNHA